MCRPTQRTTDSARGRSACRRAARIAGLSLAATAAALLASSTPAAATAVVAADAASAADLREVIGNLTRLVVGFLVSLGTLFLTLGFARYMSANGDPSEVERAKASLRNAALGYGGAVLAPVFMRLLQSVVDVS